GNQSSVVPPTPCHPPVASIIVRSERTSDPMNLRCKHQTHSRPRDAPAPLPDPAQTVPNATLQSQRASWEPSSPQQSHRRIAALHPTTKAATPTLHHHRRPQHPSASASDRELHL